MHLPSPVRLLGIDLGITSDHTAVVVDGAGSICARRRARSTVASLTALHMASRLGSTPNQIWNAAAPCSISIGSPSLAILPSARARRTRGARRTPQICRA